MKIIASIFKTLFVIYIVSLVLVSTKAFAQCPNGTYLDIIINPDQYPEETSWAVLDENLDTVVSGGPYIDIVDYSPQVTQLCVPNGDYTFEIYDLYGDGVAGSLWGGQDGSYYIVQCNDTIVEIDDADFGFSTFDGFTIDDCAPPPPIFGCMDSSFVEFLPIATVDTGMCLTPKVFGCTDSLAYNYLDTANTDILVDSCTHTLELTDLAGNGWAGSYLQVFQGNNFLGIFTLDDGFDTTFTFELSIAEPIQVKFNITQQSQFTSVQCGYSVYSDEHIAINAPGGFANPLVPFVTVQGMPYCGDNCIDRVYGCTDVTALNYNALANTDDSTCYYLVGCTNPIYLEYNPAADYDNGSCATLVVVGCMDSTAFNYDPTANVELTGSCVPTVLGCMNEFAFNYNPLANTPDTCIAIVEGCIDVTAMNYDSLANVDDNSCVYYAYGCTDPTAFNYDIFANTDDGSCVEVIYGCMDATMFNYNPNANTDNGNCIPFYYGCMDSTALNYDDDANTDNGSCIYAIYGCNDPTAINYDPLVNTPDSTCEYSAGCAIGDVYTLPNECFAWVISVDEYCCDVSWAPGCVSLYEYCQDGWSGPTDIIEVRYGLFTYPNPTKDYLYINSRLKVDITVVDMLGNVIISKSKINVLDVSRLAPGVYNVVISHDKIKTSKKIIKQ